MSVLADSSLRREEGSTSSHARSSSSPHSGTPVEKLTDDLLVDILSRVPAKSLCRFKCVSNHWLSLIDHPEHRKKLPQTLTGFFYGSRSIEDWVSAISPVSRVEDALRCTPLSPSCPSTIASNSWTAATASSSAVCTALCPGWQDMLCRVQSRDGGEEWVVLPDSGQDIMEVVTARLGFDPAMSLHFHVFELLEEDGHDWDPDVNIAGVAVYSSETGRWVYKENRWNAPIKLINLQLASVFLNGYLHFQADVHVYWLAVVDTEGETWMNFSVPDGLYDGFIQRSQDQLYYGNSERRRWCCLPTSSLCPRELSKQRMDINA